MLNVGGIVLNALAIEHFILRHPCDLRNVSELSTMGTYVILISTQHLVSKLSLALDLILRAFHV